GLEGHCVNWNRIGTDLQDSLAIIADALQLTPGQRHLPRHLENLILQRGRAEVRDQDVHFRAAAPCCLITLTFSAAFAWKGLFMSAHCWLNFSASGMFFSW